MSTNSGLTSLGVLSGSVSESNPLPLNKGVGCIFINGDFNGAAVAVQYKSSDGTWKAIPTAGNITENVDYRVDTGGIPITVRAALLSGTPNGDLVVEGGSLTAIGQQNR